MAGFEEVDLELISAFIDGRLSGDERQRALRLLGESEAAFEVYSDALRARADVSSGHIVPIAAHRKPPSNRWQRVVPIAVAAAMLVAVLPTIQSRRDRALLHAPARTIARPVLAVASVPGALGNQWDERDWTVLRGGGSATVDSSVAFRLGVRATDLQVAAAAGDRERAGRIASEMLDLLPPGSLADFARSEYEAVRTRLGDGDPLKQVAVTASAAEDRLAEFLESRWFGFGRWFSAGEIAGRTRASEFFASSATTRFLDSAIEHGDLAPEDVALLRQVSVLASQGISGEEFEMMREHFAELIRRHGG